MPWENPPKFGDDPTEVVQRGLEAIADALLPALEAGMLPHKQSGDMIRSLRVEVRPMETIVAFGESEDVRYARYIQFKRNRAGGAIKRESVRMLVNVNRALGS